MNKNKHDIKTTKNLFYLKNKFTIFHITNKLINNAKF